MSIKINSQPNIIPGNTTDYYRGDKTFQPLDKTAVGLVNVPNLDTSTTANIADIATKRFTSDVEKTAQSSINSTQTATNSTQATINTAQIATNTAQATTNANTVTALLSKEDVSNKQTNLASSSTKYPTVDAVNTGLALKQNAFNATIVSATFFDTIPPVAGLIYTSTFTGTLTSGQAVVVGEKYTWDLANNLLKIIGLPKYVTVPISMDFNTMTAGSVFPSYGAGATDFTILPVAERFTVEPLKASYKPIEIQARLVNSTATPMTFDFSIGGTAIPAINIVYSPTLVSFPIPTINQIPTSTAKLQIGVASNSLNKALEAYVIYELI